VAHDKTHDELIEAVVDYRRGLRNIKTGAAEVARLSGLTPDVAAALLKSMKQDTVTAIRGYSKEPERMRLGKERAKQRKKGQIK